MILLFQNQNHSRTLTPTTRSQTTDPSQQTGPTKWVTTYKILQVPALLHGTLSHEVSPVPPSPLCGAASETSPREAKGLEWLSSDGEKHGEYCWILSDV